MHLLHLNYNSRVRICQQINLFPGQDPLEGFTLLGLGMSGTMAVFADTEAQPGYTHHISCLHFLQICLFSDGGREPGHDAQVVS